MKLTGQKLKEKRETARLTISEVSLATKINPKVIMAMEIGEVDGLPAKTFLRGFVRSYAAFLKMNVAEVLVVFNQEMGEIAPTALSSAAPAAPTPSVDVNGDGANTIRMFVVGGIVLLIALILGVRSVIQKYQKEKMTETSVELAPSTEKEKSQFEDANAVAVAIPAAQASPTPSSVAIPVAAAIQPPAPSPAIQLKAEVAKIEPPKPKPSETPKAEAKKEPEKAKEPAGHRHEIILEAMDKVEIKFKMNGQAKILALAPNEVHTIITDEPVTLDISDGGALNITDNGRDKGPAGDLGHPKKVSIP